MVVLLGRMSVQHMGVLATCGGQERKRDAHLCTDFQMVASHLVVLGALCPGVLSTLGEASSWCSLNF